MKMDVEGAEFLALQGARKMLAQFHPTILLELSDRTLQHQGSTRMQIWSFLVESGYRVYAFDDKKGPPVPAEPKEYFDGENVIANHDTSTPLPGW